MRWLLVRFSPKICNESGRSPSPSNRPQYPGVPALKAPLASSIFRGLGEGLAEVRHERVWKTAKSFRISLGNRRVYTTFRIELEALR